jgi:hypothetical protein
MTILYVVVSILLKVIFGFDLNDQLTIEVFAFCKWLVLAGAGITIAKVAKGKTNSDNDESQIDTVDERKFYIQPYTIKLNGYLLDSEEFEIKPAINRICTVSEVGGSGRYLPRQQTRFSGGT